MGHPEDQVEAHQIADLSDATTEISQDQPDEVERERILQAIAGGKLDTLQERVAWLLNHRPRTRDSDLALQIAYWEEFEPERGGGDAVRKRDLYNLTRYNSVARARAKIQNTYKLFQASEGVRRQRGKLSDDERAKASEQQIEYPFFDVFADESGKTGKRLIVGSLWFLHYPQQIAFLREVRDWRSSRNFQSEFHFKEINDRVLPHYVAFAEFLVARAAVISFKALSVERAGVKNVDEALRELYYHLLVRGVEHEHSTGRAPLPRTIQVFKDLEEPGRDKLFMAALKERIEQVSVAKFDTQLSAEEFVPINSKGQILVQAADLYVSSLNRVLNGEGKSESAKDRFATYFLKVLQLPRGPTEEERVGDMTIHISL